MTMFQSHELCFLTPHPPQPDRPLFVFLPGMDGTGQLLHSQIPALRQTFDIRCLCLPHHDDFSGWSRLAHQTIQLIQSELKNRSNRSVYLCGESFGGCLALQVLQNAPELVDRAILINPASAFKQRPWMSWGTPFMRWCPDPLYQISTLGLLPFLIATDRVSPLDRQRLVQAMQSISAQTASWRLSLLDRFEIAPIQLRQICQPVLFLASAADRLLPSVSEVRQLMNCLPKAEAIVLPNSGHTCLLETDINLHQLLHHSSFVPEFSC
jgi:pimeloyl-ACP methyl ester carboxylesterase